MKRKKPQRKPRSMIKLVMITLVGIVLLLGGGCWWAYEQLNGVFVDSGLLGDASGEVGEGDAYTGQKYVLLLGTDARKGETMARTDTMILACVDTEKNQLALLSIPRDTRVNIPKHGMDKINCATLYGGPELATEVVSDLLGIEVNDYVLTNYDGFKDIIDALGGVTIDVEQRMYHYDPQDGGMYTIDLQPGVQRMDGDKALQYVRYRSYALGDIARTEYQQKFLAALMDELAQKGTILKLPKLLPKISGAISTTLSLKELVQLANTARKMADADANIVSQTLPGKFLDYNDVSYWSVDKSQAQKAVAKLFDGEQTQVVLGSSTVNTGSSGGGSKASGGSSQNTTPTGQGSDNASSKGNAEDNSMLPGGIVMPGAEDGRTSPQHSQIGGQTEKNNDTETSNGEATGQQSNGNAGNEGTGNEQPSNGNQALEGEVPTSPGNGQPQTVTPPPEVAPPVQTGEQPVDGGGGIVPGGIS